MPVQSSSCPIIPCRNGSFFGFSGTDDAHSRQLDANSPATPHFGFSAVSSTIFPRRDSSKGCSRQ